MMSFWLWVLAGCEALCAPEQESMQHMMGENGFYGNDLLGSFALFPLDMAAWFGCTHLKVQRRCDLKAAV